jgi:centrosomal protein CEP164
MPGVTVLDTDDEERSPTEDEVIEYAQFLDIDPETEPHLLWIAREGVVAPVPPPWKACTESGDDVFYFNFDTGESVWDHPSDEKYKTLVEEEREKHRIAQDEAKTSASGPDKDRKRLELITNEISDEESLSPKSQRSPQNNSQLNQSQASPKNNSLISPSCGDEVQPVSFLNDSVASSASTQPRSLNVQGDTSVTSASPATADVARGTAGVGLAPAANVSIDSVEEAKEHAIDTEQSSPSHSQSSCPAPGSVKSGNLTNIGARSALEHSGASGQSGRSEIFSEVSEELISDFDGPVREEGSLELSATIDPWSNVKTDVAPQDIAAEGRKTWADDSSHLKACDVDDNHGNSRLKRLQDELASLGRVLGKLREIRGHQKEFLNLLQVTG